MCEIRPSGRHWNWCWITTNKPKESPRFETAGFCCVYYFLLIRYSRITAVISLVHHVPLGCIWEQLQVVQAPVIALMSFRVLAPASMAAMICPLVT